MLTIPAGDVSFVINDEVGYSLSSFQFSESPVTWDQWGAMLDWSRDHGFSYGPYGDPREFFEPSPTTTLDFREVVVYCNALTAFYNGENHKALRPVYWVDAEYTLPLTDANSITDEGSNTVYFDSSADGYRLPTYIEWEYLNSMVPEERWLGKDAHELSVYCPYWTGNGEPDGPGNPLGFYPQEGPDWECSMKETHFGDVTLPYFRKCGVDGPLMYSNSSWAHHRYPEPKHYTVPILFIRSMN